MIVEIAAVEIAAAAGVDRMVAELPDTAAEKALVPQRQIPVGKDVARGHGADVFAQEKRLLGELFFEITADIADVRIHAALDIRDVGEALALGHGLEFKVRVFIVDKGFGIAALNIRPHGAVVDAAARLVAQRPHDDAAAVFVSLIQARGAVDIGLAPFRRVGKRRPARPVPLALPVVAHAVRFQIGFVNDHEAELVAVFEESRVVWIVRGADGVAVGLFQQSEIAEHMRLRRGMAEQRVRVVAVDAARLDGLIV